jgi:hypothetical protein
MDKTSPQSPVFEIVLVDMQFDSFEFVASVVGINVELQQFFLDFPNSSVYDVQFV